jgi:hypothetical protein
MTGKFPSWKMERMLQWESKHELNAFRLLDSDPHVLWFCEQPCEVRYVLDGSTHSHVPDILLARDGQKELWEIKTAENARHVRVMKRSSLLSRILPQWGYTYRVVESDELSVEPRLSNATILLRFGGSYVVSDFEREFIRRALKGCDGITWSNACAGEYGLRGREIVCSLVLRGELSIAMDQPLGFGTHFIPRNGEL